MPKHPSLYHQLHRAIEKSFTPGVAKHDMESYDQQSRIFSYEYRQKLNDFAADLGRSIKAEHPDVQFLKDVKPEYVSGFLQRKADAGCSEKYLKTMTSYCSKLGSLSSDLYQRDIN